MFRDNQPSTPREIVRELAPMITDQIRIFNKNRSQEDINPPLPQGRIRSYLNNTTIEMPIEDYEQYLSDYSFKQSSIITFHVLKRIGESAHFQMTGIWRDHDRAGHKVIDRFNKNIQGQYPTIYDLRIWLESNPEISQRIFQRQPGGNE